MFELIINSYAETSFKGCPCCVAAESVQVEMPVALSNKTLFLLSGEPMGRGI
jgi:hypothetical protein